MRRRAALVAEAGSVEGEEPHVAGAAGARSADRCCRLAQLDEWGRALGAVAGMPVMLPHPRLREALEAKVLAPEAGVFAGRSSGGC